MFNNETVCVILAGGRGKRMASADRHKVCFPIGGRPAIVRAIDTYKEAGITRFLVVVGQMAEQVITTVASAHPEVMFVCQTDARGTGHAALVAVEALAAQRFDGTAMIVMGDKVTKPEVVRAAMERFAHDEPDALLTTLPKTSETTAGRVVVNGQGEVLGIVELADIKRARADSTPLYVGGLTLSGDEVEQHSATVNVSMYVFRFSALRQALRHISPNNAQGELYLTDTAEYIVRTGRVTTLALADPTDLMAFNTPAELLAIEEVVLAREGRHRIEAGNWAKLSQRVLKPAMEWLSILDQYPAPLHQELSRIYGTDANVIADRRNALLRVTRAFIGKYGPDRPVILGRAPGRINLMGRHIDHRGGFVNVMAINREVLVAAAPRDDDVVRLAHVDVNEFPNREFRIADLLKEASWGDWMDFLASSTVQRVLNAAPGDWSHYVRAPLLRLQYEQGHGRLRGMDCMVCGNIPMGAGLSSSSALVVAFAEAAVALNGLDVATRDFIDLCGEGEWFVGSRGGSADHAAIRTGQLGHVSRIGFFPSCQTGEVPFPAELRVVIAHSGSRAIKSVEARDVFNQRIACYNFAEMLLRHRWPAAAGMKHLRDLVPEHLQVEPADIYHALTLLPVRPSRKQLRELLPEHEHERMERIFTSHANLGGYDLRGVTLFGISECVRSERFAEAISAGDLDRIAAFMRASHDGDRCFSFLPGGASRRFAIRCDDRTLGDLANQNAPLAEQPGRYACSTEAIDCLVDIANACPGVVGAQLAGAGLGGCMMILVHEDHQEELLARLGKRFYAPRNIEPDIHVCTPVAGAGLISVNV